MSHPPYTANAGFAGQPPEAIPPVHILVVNQHGDNRGDEAALRAMLRTFSELLAERGRGVRFTVVHQSRDRELRLRFDEVVEAIPMLLPALDAAGLVTWAAARRLGLSLPILLSATTRRLVSAYRDTALVVSAPGGPYFGDIYRDHELVHWFFVWMARLFRKPTFLYATSAGPFATPLLNGVRRRMFRSFSAVCLREPKSAAYVRELCGSDFPLTITADSALQQRAAPISRSQYFQGERAPLADRFLVALTAIHYKFPELADPQPAREAYERAFLAAVAHLAQCRRCHFLFFPQLYGRSHSDMAFLRGLGAQLGPEVSWEVVDPDLDADAHQKLIAACDLSIASRYHPQIFAAAGAVPGVCIYYEHKAASFMSELELSDLAFSIRDVESAPLCEALDRVLADGPAIRAKLERGIVRLRQRARRTTELALELVDVDGGVDGGGEPPDTTTARKEAT